MATSPWTHFGVALMEKAPALPTWSGRPRKLYTYMCILYPFCDITRKKRIAAAYLFIMSHDLFTE